MLKKYINTENLSISEDLYHFINDEVIPAQNNPIDIKYFEKLPRMGVS